MSKSRMVIYQVGATYDTSTPEVVTNASSASGLDFHYKKDLLYWSDIETRKVSVWELRTVNSMFITQVPTSFVMGFTLSSYVLHTPYYYCLLLTVTITSLKNACLYDKNDLSVNWHSTFQLKVFNKFHLNILTLSHHMTKPIQLTCPYLPFDTLLSKFPFQLCLCWAISYNSTAYAPRHSHYLRSQWWGGYIFGSVCLSVNRIMYKLPGWFSWNLVERYSMSQRRTH